MLPNLEVQMLLKVVQQNLQLQLTKLREARWRIWIKQKKKIQRIKQRKLNQKIKEIIRINLQINLISTNQVKAALTTLLKTIQMKATWSMIQVKSFFKMEKLVNHNNLMTISRNHSQRWKEEKEDTEVAKQWTGTKAIWVDIKDTSHRAITMEDSAMVMSHQAPPINKAVVEATLPTKEEQALPNQRRRVSSSQLK